MPERVFATYSVIMEAVNEHELMFWKRVRAEGVDATEASVGGLMLREMLRESLAILCENLRAKIEDDDFCDEVASHAREHARTLLSVHTVDTETPQ